MQHRYFRFLTESSGGYVLPLLATLMALIIGIGALGYDLGKIFLLENRLQIALDAAVLRGAQLRSAGADEADVTLAGRELLRANLSNSGFRIDAIESIVSGVQFNFPDARTIAAVGNIDHRYSLARVLPIGTDRISARVLAQAAVNVSVEPQPATIIFVLDRTGSMDADPDNNGRTKFEELQAVMSALIPSLVNVEIGVVLYANPSGSDPGFNHLNNGEQLRYVTGDNIDEIVDEISRLPGPNGYTNIGLGLEQGYLLLEASRTRRRQEAIDRGEDPDVAISKWNRAMILMTDGQANRTPPRQSDEYSCSCSGCNDYLRAERDAVEWSDEVKGFENASGGVTLYSVGFGGPGTVNLGFLRRVSGLSDAPNIACSSDTAAAPYGPRTDPAGDAVLAENQAELAAALASFISQVDTSMGEIHLTQ